MDKTESTNITFYKSKIIKFILVPANRKKKHSKILKNTNLKILSHFKKKNKMSGKSNPSYHL